MRKSGILTLLATPIGNPEDITLRALKALKQADILICEELKIGRRFLSRYSIKKELIPLNEHNESKQVNHLISLLKKGHNLCLFSDCGSPVFADPGFELVQACIKNNIKMTSLPGASSLMLALTVCGFNIKEFYFAGFLPQKSNEREHKLNALKKIKNTLVIYDTPYRLTTLLNACVASFGKNKQAALCQNLTTENENIKHGSLEKLAKDQNATKSKKMYLFLSLTMDNVKSVIIFKN